VSGSQIRYVDPDRDEPLAVIAAPSVVLSSVGAPWSGLRMEQLRLPPMELPESLVQEHLFTIKLSEPSTLERRQGTRFTPQLLGPGDVCFVPAGMPRQLRWQDAVEVLVLALDPARIGMGDAGAGLREGHGAVDIQVQHLALALRAELVAGCPSGRLYADALETALSIHLRRQYGDPSIAAPSIRGGLGPCRLRQVLAFIDDHLAEDLGLAEIAACVQMSPSRFKQLFKESMCVAPHQYVIAQRVERAQRLLRDSRTDRTLSEIARDVGFCDQSHLNRHFKRLIGITPKAFAQGE